MASSEKRCLYEVLGLSRDCTADEIRSAYRRLALQRHPDKLSRSGVPEAEATAAFQELVNAYEVLSDTKERAWYDSHRNQILFSSTSAATGSSSLVPELFSFFSNSVYSGYSDSGRGFYKVYGDLFDKIYANELSFAKKLGLPLPKEAPVMGNLESPYAQVTAFYNHWLGFISGLDFFWADQYDAMAGQNRKSRRVMEEENKKARKKSKREYNETVRGLAEFVKKRDKRVIDMQLKRNAEMERKREEEKQRKKELERQKAEKARNYEEPEWAQVEEDDEAEDFFTVEEKRSELTEFYCVACSKKFKSDKQWRNHEQSKKHKERVAELREAFSEEDKEYEATASQGNKGEAVDDDEMIGLVETLKDNVGIQEDDSDDGKTESSKANEFDNNNNDGGEEIDDDDDETSILEAMLSGHKSRNNLTKSKVQVDIDSDDSDDGKTESSKANEFDKNNNDGGEEIDDGDDDETSILEAMLSGHKSRNNLTKSKVQVDIDSDELEFMEYNDTKGSRRNRGGRRRRHRRQEDVNEEKEGKEEVKEELEEEKEELKVAAAEEVKEEGKEEATEEIMKAEMAERNGEAVERSHPLPESKTKRLDEATERHRKHSQQAANKKSKTKKENASKSKAASKGRKQKMTENDSDIVCEKCGEQFETRNKLHKHLADTGHTSLKSR